MIASYRLGLAIVAGTLAAASAFCVAVVDHRPVGATRGEDLADMKHQLGPFALTQSTGRPLTDADLADRAWVAAFIFTRCQSSCPKITKVMKRLQSDLAGTGVTLVSITVDPDYDTPDVLAMFARLEGADPSRWMFLTGDKARVHRLILEGFIQTVSETPLAERGGDVEDVSHSDRLTLVGPGNVVLGAYKSTEPDSVRRLVANARVADRMARASRTPWVLKLPGINATLNGSSAVLLILGWLAIRSRRIKLHVACMATALVVSGVFLGCYLVYHYFVGSVAFRGVGPIRVAYFSILLSHTVLAVAIVPLIVTTVVLALRGRFAAHARLARVTFPIWLYVSITGVVVYWMLYQMPLATGSPI